MKPEQVFNAILPSALEGYHGMWYDRILTNSKSQRKLAGQPQFSTSFWNLYGYSGILSPSTPPPSIKRIVSPEDHKRVLLGIRRALNEDSGSVNFTIQVNTVNGKEKLVEIYLRRIHLDDGTEIMASLHIDLTASSDEHWLRKKLLDQMPGFVFIKRYDPNANVFRFAYINRKLAEAFSLEEPSDAFGKCDKDFIVDAGQVEKFHKVDLSVIDRSEDQPPIVREEWFSVNGADGNIQTRKLMTIKMPYGPPGTVHHQTTQILGVAVDVTAYTDLMRAVAEKSELGIYIKNSLHEYEIVNTTFLKLMGIEQESDIIDKTFSQIIDEKKASLSHKINPLALDKLCADVAKEDKDVINGGYSGHVRTAEFFDTAEWLTEKHCIKAGLDAQPHILGVASPLFGGSSMQMLEKLPQCVCVKRYYPDAERQRQFRIVWANRRYMERHGFQDPSSYRGKSDYEISAHHSEQADRYYEKDLQVVNIGKKISSDVRPERQNFTSLIAALRKENCWEYRESQEDRDRKKFTLQTTKWPEHIHGTWFVVVVYSDITKGEKLREMYHDMTVHTIRGMIVPVDTALWAINESDLRGEELISTVKECLIDTDEDAKWFLDHHLNLIKMQIKTQHIQANVLAEMLHIESTRVLRRTRWETRASVTVQPTSEELSTTKVSIDAAFIRAVISELFRNAYKAIERRQNFVGNLKTGDMNEAEGRKNGWTDFSTAWTPQLEARLEIVGDSLMITISDNGDAAANSKEAMKLKKRFGAAHSASEERRDLRLGLAFISLTMQRHGGNVYLTLGRSKPVTAFSIVLPLITAPSP